MTTSVEERALLGVARLVMHVSIRATAELDGPSPVQLRALTALRQLEQANLAQLAEEIGVTVSTTSRLVDRLVAAEWVQREPSLQNRREIRLTLRPAGQQLLRQFDERRVALLRECLQHVPADRQEAVVHALAELAHVPRA